METKTKQEGDIEIINKFTGFQLPNKFKKVGFVLFIISFIGLFLIAVYLENLDHSNLCKRIVSTINTVGLLMIVVSREKIEDELIAKIRLQSYHYAVVATVLFYLIVPFAHFIILSLFSKMPVIEGSKDISVLFILLLIQILIFRKLKKAYNEE